MNDHRAVRWKVQGMTVHSPRLGNVLRTVGTAAGVGLAVVGVTAEPGAVFGGVMLSAFVGGGLAVRLQDRPAANRGATLRSAIKAGATALWLWLAGTGLVVLLGWAEAVPVALLLLGLSAGRYLRRRFAAAESPAAPPLTLTPSPRIGTLSTANLCHVWRQSYLTLIDLPIGPHRSELVAVRQLILDELERRDAVGFHRWLEAGPRAGSDPGRYVATDA